MIRSWFIAIVILSFAGCSVAPHSTKESQPPSSSAEKKLASDKFEMEELTFSSKKFASVNFVDQIGNKYLFRGPSPLNNSETEFDYDGLVKKIVEAGKEAEVEVPVDFYLVDVSLLHIDILEDRRRIIKEEEFFRRNPDLGQFQSMDTWGTERQLTDEQMTEETRNFLIKDVPNWLPGPLTKRVDLLRTWMEDPNLPKKVDKPTVIYVHCYEGCDRTGELIGGYLMRYKNTGWEDVNRINSGICERPWRCDYYRATQWYCAWLKDSQGLGLNCESYFKCLKDRNDD